MAGPAQQLFICLQTLRFLSTAEDTGLGVHQGGCSPLGTLFPLWQANGFWAEEDRLRLGSTIDMQHIPDLEKNSPESQLQFIDPGSAVLKPKINRPAGSYLLVTGWLDVGACSPRPSS